jgi:nitrite reductase/ring-hydroxylating ferredoxin subunit
LCPHRNGPLGQGNLADGYIICPWHAWEFSASTGEFDFNPAIRLREFAVEIRGGAVWVAVG